LLSMHARLMRGQAVRQKREATDSAATQDAWTQHVAEQSMLKVADPDIERQQAAPRQAPQPAPLAAPPPQKHQTAKQDVSETTTNSHDMALETWMSAQPWNQGPERPDETDLRKRLREAMAGSRLAGRESPANTRQSPGRTG
jgi:hypothetical protein